MKNNLVSTAIKETFSAEDNNIILGDWCHPYIDEKSKFKLKKIQFHWESPDKKKRDYEYLQKLYYKILKNLTASLNTYHSIQKEERYWHIIVGPFLLNFLQILWDRWENVRVAFKEEKINETRIIDTESNELICSDFKDTFDGKKNDHLWNHMIYSEILNFLKFKNLNIIKIKKIFKNEKVVFYKSYIEKKSLIKLCFKLNQLPRKYNELSKKINFITLPNREKFKVNINPANEFENFFEKTLLKIMPYSYLENYKKIRDETKKIKLTPKVIFTAAGQTSDDFFKIWAAEKVLKGSKYIVSDHGGYMDDKQNFDAWSNFSDCYLRWNLVNKKNIKQMPLGILFKKYKNLDTVKSNKILLLSSTSNIYPNKIQSPPMTGQIIDDVKLWENFYIKLDKEKKESFKIRVHITDPWNIKNYFLKKYGKRILSNKKDFKEDIESSKIIINTNFSTPFFETIHSARPTIVLSQQSHFSLSNEKIELLKELLENKILFKDIQSAINHLNNIYDNPFQWWNSDKILKIKEKFHNLCFVKKKNDLDYWKNFFLSYL